MLHMIFAPPGCGKSQEIQKNIKLFAENGAKDMILLVPEQISFESEREMLKLLGYSHSDCIQVLSFSRFCDKFFEKFGGRNKRRIDEIGKTALMEAALKKVQSTLELFKKQANSPSFAEELIKLDSHMKRFCVSAEQMMKLSEANDGIFQKKLKEISLIISEYEKSIDDEYYDPVDDLSKISERLSFNRFFENKIVFFDAFNGFTAQQMPIIEQIICQASETYISLSLDKNAQNDPMGIYTNMFATAQKIKQLARQNGVKIAPDVELNDYLRYENDEMKAVAKYAYRTESGKYDKKAQFVHVAKLRDIYAECDYVASNIKRLVRTQNLRYRDIAVITRNTEKYAKIIEHTFADYSIPCFIDAKKNAEGTALIKFCASSIEAAYSFSTNAILAMLKTGLADIDENDVALLDNYTFIWSIDGGDWQEEFSGNMRGMDVELNDDDRALLNKLNEIRKTIIDLLTPLRSALLSGKIRTIATALYTFIKASKADIRLNKFCCELEKQGRNDEAQVQRKAYDLLINLLDQFVMALDKYDVDYKKFHDLFLGTVKNADIGKLPQGLDEIAIGSAERMRPKSPKVTFVIGAIEGEFPAIFSGSGLFSDSDLIKLKENGIELPCYDEQRAIDENFLCFFAMCSPSCELYATCYMLEDNCEVYPSSVITELCKIFNFDLPLVSSSINDLESKVAALEMFALMTNENSEQKATLKAYFEADNNMNFERIIHANDKIVTEFDSKTAVALFGKDLYLSASKIDKFYHCSFGYFCNYGLNISPIKPAKIDNLSRGTLIHLILSEFVSKYSISDYFALSFAEKNDIAHKIVREQMMAYINAKRSDKIEQYRLNEICRTMIKMLDVIYEELKQTEYSVVKTELSFGSGDDADYGEMKIKLKGGATAHITGKIDRVDSFEKDGQTFVRIIDYKSGANKFRLADVLRGQNLQMLLYLAAYKEAVQSEDNKICVPAGIMYYPVKSVSDSSNIRRSQEQAKELLMKNMKMNGFLLNEEDSLWAMEPGGEGVFAPISVKDGVISFSGGYSRTQYDKITKYMKKLICQMGEMLHNGKISINPLNGATEACKYCDFAAVCRKNDDFSCDTVKDISNEQAFEILEKEDEQ